MIANEYSLDLDSKKLKKLYEFCTDKTENFLLTTKKRGIEKDLVL
jgi:hypothetical protein